MRLLLALALLFCSLQEAVALQKANAQDYHDINDQLIRKNVAEAQIELKVEALRKAKGDKASKLEIEIAALGKEQKNAAEQAMWLTARAYDIIAFADNEPRLDAGVSVIRSPEKDKRIAWLPVFEDIGVKPVQDEFGRIVGTKKILPKNAGNTASDGISRIFPGAFTSPVELASYLIHEQRHFKQITTKNVGDAKTTAELEVEAYEEEQRLLTEDVLGYPPAISERQQIRLTGLLEGDSKGPGFRVKAKEERAAVDKTRGGRPLPERSLVSHSEDEINSLIKRAKEQIVIAQRDHDERLRNTLLKLTAQSCANPGSVTQAELDGLPKPHNGYYLTSFRLPDRCSSEYMYMALGGRNADVLRSTSAAQPVRPAPAAQPVPELPIARQPLLPPFSSAFLQMRGFALNACASPEQVSIDAFLTRFYDLSNEALDNSLAKQSVASLDDCSRLLFNEVFSTMRAQSGRLIDRQWIRNKVAEFSPRPGTTPGSGNPPPGGGGRGCERNGDPFGCQPKHP
jgi:hypothetical protein